MANTTVEILETRVVIKPEFTELYVLYGPPSDGLLGVQGWHKKVIGPSEVALDVLRDDLANGRVLVEWDTGAPPERGGSDG